MPNARKILVAVPNEMRYVEALKDVGWDVLTAGDAQRAYDAARHNGPAAVVLHARLGRGGAATALQWMRSSLHTAAIPVIVLATGGRDAESELLKAGAQQVLPGDADPRTVCAAVEAQAGKAPIVTGVPAATLGDSRRLAALRGSGLLDSPADEVYDRLTRLAARLTEAPVAALSLVDQQRQFFKSQVGMADPSKRQTPVSQSFCQWVVAGGESVVVEDAASHPVLKHNPAMRHMGVAAYAGIPVRASNGTVLGSFCAVDSHKRSWTPEQLAMLTDLALLAEVLAARNALNHGPAPTVGDVKWYSTAAAAAIKAAARILRRPDLDAEDRLALLDEIEEGTESLMKIRAAARGSRTH